MQSDGPLIVHVYDDQLLLCHPCSLHLTFESYSHWTTDHHLYSIDDFIEVHICKSALEWVAWAKCVTPKRKSRSPVKIIQPYLKWITSHVLSSNGLIYAAVQYVLLFLVLVVNPDWFQIYGIACSFSNCVLMHFWQCTYCTVPWNECCSSPTCCIFGPSISGWPC